MSESTSSTTNASTTNSTRDDGRSTTSSTNSGSGTSGSQKSSGSSDSSSSKSSTSGSKSESSKSGGKGKRVYDRVDTDPKSPNSSANPLGPITRVKDGNGDETKIYSGMTVGYASGPENTYEDGQYSSDGVNAFYEARSRDGVQLPS